MVLFWLLARPTTRDRGVLDVFRAFLFEIWRFYQQLSHCCCHSKQPLNGWVGVQQKRCAKIVRKRGETCASLGGVGQG